jgi:nicotinamide-nucleotide amidase
MILPTTPVGGGSGNPKSSIIDHKSRMSSDPVLAGLKEVMLRQPPLTLSVAESLTTGQVQTRIGAVPGASNFFLGGITAYTLDQKVRHLGVDQRTAEPVNCVSAAVAEQMARGACEFFGSDVGLATTGYAEPAPQWDVLEPFAWWALAHREKPHGKFIVRSARVEFPSLPRTEVQARVADTVLTALVAYLREARPKVAG